MIKETVYFSHANGFPALSYKTLFRALEDNFSIRYIESLGHHPSYPAKESWAHLTQELINNLEREGLKKIVGIGHSLGGVITLFAATLRPDLFKAIILLDPPIFTFPKTFILQWLKKTDRMSWILPTHKVAKRRTQWNNIEEAIEHFKRKPLFQNFHPDCLRDYVTHGTRFQGENLTLIFDPTIEAEIFKNLPHNYKEYIGKLQIKGKAFFGRESKIANYFDKRRLAKDFNVNYQMVSGGHLFPFEYPFETAHVIKNAIQELI